MAAVQSNWRRAVASGAVVSAVAIAAVAVAVPACSPGDRGNRGNRGERDRTTETLTVQAVGIDPDAFRCDSVAPLASLQSALGGEVVAEDAQFPAPDGAPRPCNYVRRDDAGQQQWSFDLDCRKQALRDASALMEQYKATGNDAGSADIDVGRGGLDHHGLSLIFIDDDTPCYVRVHGPSAPGRRALAEMIAAALTEDTAPMPTIYRAR